MRIRRHHQAVQLNLLQTRPRLPAWASLPERCRQEVVVLLLALLEQHAATGPAGEAVGDDDE